MANVITDGTHFTPDYVENGIPFLSAINVKKGYLDLDAGYKLIAPQDHKTLCKRVLPRKNDVLLRKVGVGARLACVVPNLPFEFSIFVSLALIRGDLNPYYLSAFINSKFGQAQLLRFNKGISQPDLHLEDIARLRVPLFSESFYNCIQNVAQNAEKFLSTAKQKIDMAENTLIRVLNLAVDNRSYISVKTFADSFIQSGRLDAEYYQPKYEQLFLQLNSYEKVSTLCNLYDENFIPDVNTEYDYIELSNVDTSGDILSTDKIIGSKLPSRARRLVHKGQVIISSIEGSLSSCALIDADHDDALCSTGFYVIDSDKINSETLLMLFKSAPIQALLKQKCSGTILTAISKDEFLNIPLPYINKNIQEEISNQVQESFRLRKEAKRLLAHIIKAVEMAVEEDEYYALQWLEMQ